MFWVVSNRFKKVTVIFYMILHSMLEGTLWACYIIPVLVIIDINILFTTNKNNNIFLPTIVYSYGTIL